MEFITTEDIFVGVKGLKGNPNMLQQFV